MVVSLVGCCLAASDSLNIDTWMYKGNPKWRFVDNVYLPHGYNLATEEMGGLDDAFEFCEDDERCVGFSVRAGEGDGNRTTFFKEIGVTAPSSSLTKTEHWETYVKDWWVGVIPGSSRSFPLVIHSSSCAFLFFLGEG